MNLCCMISGQYCTRCLAYICTMHAGGECAWVRVDKEAHRIYERDSLMKGHFFRAGRRMY